MGSVQCRAMDDPPVPRDTAFSWTSRVARHRAVSDRLASLDERQMTALLDAATAGGVGIGGTTTSLTVDGVPVFVKRVPLTDLERRCEHVGSTANIFQLPTCYQYGIGSTGFGAWRELAVHEMTTCWVLENRFPGFPMLYHWRVLPQSPAAVHPAELERWNFRHFLVQPMDGPPGTMEAAVRLAMERPRWRLSLQAHKILGLA